MKGGYCNHGTAIINIFKSKHPHVNRTNITYGTMKPRKSFGLERKVSKWGWQDRVQSALLIAPEHMRPQVAKKRRDPPLENTLHPLCKHLSLLCRDCIKSFETSRLQDL